MEDENLLSNNWLSMIKQEKKNNKDNVRKFTN